MNVATSKWGVSLDENTYQEFRLEAVGCGNTFTNPDYEQCIQDPEKNVFTYLNIENGLSKKMNSFFARRDKTWHIGFQGTKIILNSGDNGPGDTRVTSLYLYRPFYENESPAFQKLAEESFGNKGIRFFELEHDFRNAPYALPAGIDRVIFEDDWLRSSRGIFSANQNSWWLIKNREQRGSRVYNRPRLCGPAIGNGCGSGWVSHHRNRHISG